MFKLGDVVTMTPIAIENYGEIWLGVELVITHVATNEEQHPGFDRGTGSALYDLAKAEDETPLPMSLYDWELEQ